MKSLVLSKMDRVSNLIGLAYKARKVLYGEQGFNAIKENKAKLVLLAEDTFANTKKKVLDKCAYYQVPVITVSSREELSKSIGKVNIVMIVIVEEGFAKNILNA